MSIDNKVSSKFLTIISVDTLRTIADKANSTEHQLLFITSYGIIKGDITDITTDEDLSASIKNTGSATYNLSYAINIKNEHINKLKSQEEELTFNDNGAVLHLTNVSVYKNDLLTPILHINTMLVFVDQIVSVSVVPRNHNT